MHWLTAFAIICMAILCMGFAFYLNLYIQT